MTNLHLLLLLLTITATAAQAASDWQTMPDVNAPKVRELADFAVAEHNRKIGRIVNLDKILTAEQQVVDGGMNYRLYINVSGFTTGTYKAIVLEKNNVKDLTDWVPANP